MHPKLLQVVNLRNEAKNLLGLEGRSANFLPIFCIGKFCETS